jgi:hypothetical protein
MGKTLVNLAKGAKKAVATLLAIASLGTASCQQGGISPKEYYNPAVKIYASQTSGTAPLESRLNLESSVEGGAISKSYLFADYDGDKTMDPEEELVSSDSGSIDNNYTFTKSGTFNVYGQSESDQGKIGISSPVTMTIQPKPNDPTNPVEPAKDYIDFSGNVQDCETDTGRPSIVQIWDTQNSDGTYSDLLKEVPTDSNGNWSATLEKVVDSSDKISGRTRTGTSSSQTSYVRTIDLPATDHNPITDPRGNPAIRVVPYNPNWTIQQIGDFLIHAGRGNIWSDEEKIAAGIDGFVNGNSKHGLKKADNIKGIKVSTSTPNYADYVSEINAKGIKTVTEENPVYEKGWGVILPDTTGDGPRTLLYDTEGLDGQVEGFVTYLNDCGLDVGRHEWWWHGLHACSGHVNSPAVTEKFPSEGRWQSPYPATSTKEDKILYSIINDPTFLGMESENAIMSLN